MFRFEITTLEIFAKISWQTYGHNRGQKCRDLPSEKMATFPLPPSNNAELWVKKKMKRKWVRLGSQQCLGKTKGWTQSRSINCHSESYVNPFIWWRYIDDIFMIWTRSVQDLNTIIPFLNNIHSTIKYTAMFSSGPYPFSMSTSHFKMMAKSSLTFTPNLPTNTNTYYTFVMSSHTYLCTKRAIFFQ